MRRLVFILSALILAFTASAQEVSVDELLTLTSLTPDKFNQYIAKRGYSKSSQGFAHDSIAQTWQPKKNTKKKKEVVRTEIERSQYGKINTLHYRTSSLKDYLALRGRLKKEGFECPADTSIECDLPLVYTRKNLTINVNMKVEEEDTLYTFRIDERKLPGPIKVQYAEDLLQLESHLEVEHIFGEANVKKDKYYFTDDEWAPCTVIFPNTSRQAVFLWQNDSTYSELYSVIFGGNLNASTNITYSSQVAENSWVLSNGIHCNLNLRELIRMAGGNFQFYGKKSDMFLSIVPGSAPDLELKDITVVLGCLNCNNSSILDVEKVNAQDALRTGLGMFVITVMLTPERPVSR